VNSESTCISWITLQAEGASLRVTGDYSEKDLIFLSILNEIFLLGSLMTTRSIVYVGPK